MGRWGEPRRSCVLPDHLFLGTQAENLGDMALKGRGSVSRRGLPFGVTQEGSSFSAKYTLNRKTIHVGSFTTITAAAARAASAKTQARRIEMNPAGPNQTAKPASLSKGEVPSPQKPAPPASREGINSLNGPAK